jgi:hypothetical protein
MWQPIETVPNDVFDVIAKHWDAALDIFLLRRICECVKVNDEIYVGLVDGKQAKLTDLGYKATHWMPIPDPPKAE